MWGSVSDIISIVYVCCDSTSLAGSYARLSLRQDVTEHDAVMAIYLYEESITSRSGQCHIVLNFSASTLRPNHNMPMFSVFRHFSCHIVSGHIFFVEIAKSSICTECMSFCGELWPSGRMQNSQSRVPGFESHLHHFEVWAFSFSPRHPSSLSCISEYLAIDTGDNTSE